MKSRILGVLKELEGVITPELLTFWEDLILSQDDDGSKSSEAVFTLNLKKGIEAASVYKQSIPWLPETTQAYVLMRDFLYNSRYNDDRDRIRYKLEGVFPNEAATGLFDHLEIFTSREMLNAKPGESAKKARLRHLTNGTLPLRKKFISAVSAHSEDALLRVLSEYYLNDNELFMLEALMSSFHKGELDEVHNKSTWLSELGYTGSWPLRPTKIRRLRQSRWLGWEVIQGYILAQIVEFQFDHAYVDANRMPDPINTFVVVPSQLSKVVKLLADGDQLLAQRYRRNHVMATPWVVLTDSSLKPVTWSRDPLQAIQLFKEVHLS